VARDLLFFDIFKCPMRIQQELALDSFTVVYGYGKTIEEGGAAGK